jgi:hypothetical protein
VGEFYATLAQVSFTVLGLWMVGVQARPGDLAGDRRWRRGAQTVALHLALPGFMSLMNLAAPDSGAMWRVSFAGFALVGLAGTALLGSASLSEGSSGAVARLIHVAALAAYGVVAMVALFAPLVRSTFGWEPLVVEAVTLSLLLLLTMQRALAMILGGGPAASETT